MKNLNPNPYRGKKKAFALVLAIAAMAFMVLLTLTLSSVITSKLRLLNAQKEMRSARANAILGMSVAMSQIQRTMGKDNAISIPATLLDNDPDTVQIENVLTPFVVGAISVDKENSRMDAKELQEEQRDIFDSLRKGGSSDKVTWFISSQKAMKNPIEENITDLSSETVNLAEFSMLTDYPGTFGQTITNSQKSEKVQVRAGKVEVTSDGSGNTGSYAWWVSDESMKAKINLARPERYLDEDSGNASLGKAPADSRIPQISNLSFVESLINYNLNPFADGFDEYASANFAKATSLDELAIVDNGLAEWAKQNKNDWTAYSVGIPVDVTQGRLKEDLTVFLDGKGGPSRSEPMIRGSGQGKDRNYTGVKFGDIDFSTNMPRFGHLKTWAEIAENAKNFSDGVDVQPDNFESGNAEHGIYPMISRVGLYFLPAYHIDRDDALWTPSANLQMALVMWPKITIWNPHNVTLKKTSYTIRIYVPLAFYSGLTRGHEAADIHAYTLWMRETMEPGDGGEYKDPSGKYVSETATPIERVVYAGTRAGPHFGDFLQSKADNYVPVLSFQVRDLELRPGETVQLVTSPNASPGTFGTVSMAQYQDTKNPSGSTNLLEPGYYEKVTGLSANNVDITSGRGMLLKLGPNASTPVTMQMKEPGRNGSDTIVVTATRESGKDYMTAVSGTTKYAFWPVSKVETLNVSKDGLSDNPFLNAWFVVKGAAYDGNPRSYARCGHELLLNDSNQRLYYFDLTEWTGNTSLSGTTNATNYRHDAPIRGFHRNNVGNNFNWNYGDPSVKENEFNSLLINRIEALDNTSMTNEQLQKGNFLILYKGLGTGLHKDGDNTKDFQQCFREDKAVRALTYTIQGLQATESPIFTAGNVRASSLKSSNDDVSATIKRVESSAANRRNYGVAREISPFHKSSDIFFGKAYYTGPTAWDAANPIPNGMLKNDDLMQAYSSNMPSDGYNMRLGANVLLGAGSGLGYDHPICAVFDYPRSLDDLMSLGMLTHMNFSNMPWHPTWAFGESFAPPFWDRDVIYENHVVNPNEAMDLSFIINASLWDRFYMSSLTTQHASRNLTAGMRLPNTRYFIKSMPDDSSELYGSDDAYEKSAAYIGIDGPFNVNTTSYEAWRAFLGGMLGTQKETLTKKKINENGKNPSDPETFSMPNPGSMKPVALPANEDANKNSGSGSYSYYTYKDMMVGRSISEAEIDQLAREIVAEVKRRAPFFSLSDFVNRKLIAYESGSDRDSLSKKYQGLMGTIAAAIHRSTQDTNRPEHFFGSEKFDSNPVANRTNKGENTFVRKGTELTVWDNNHAGSNVKDLGEYTKDNQEQYIEQAFMAPISLENSRVAPAPGMLNQRDILAMIAPFITVRGDTFTIRAYGESKNAMTGTTSRAYCEAVVQRSSEPVDATDDIVAPESPFGRRFNVVSFRWLTPAEL